MEDLVKNLSGQFKKQLDGFVPQVGLILGSGLGGLVEKIKVIARVSYRDCPGLFVSTVAGHAGEFVFGFLEDIPVMCMNGRVHLYEGANALQLLTPIRLMKILGCATLFLTNAAGSLREDWFPGTIVLIEDQLNFTGVSVLRGPNNDAYGPRFVGMEHAYDLGLRELFLKAAQDLGVTLKQGVYVGVMGPAYESPAEIKAFAKLGGDMVGMSTVHEVIAARHVGLRVAGLTLVTNLGAGLSSNLVNHQEVLEVAKHAGEKMKSLIECVFKML